MSATKPAAAAGGATPAYEWSAEYDSGVWLSVGRPWIGLRVRWRKSGSRRWNSFILDLDGGPLPSREQMEEAIAVYDREAASRRSRS